MSGEQMLARGRLKGAFTRRMKRREKRSCLGKPASGGSGKLSTSITHHPVIASEARQPSSIVTTKAFTLIELLVVISILVMLMAILLPTLGRVRKQVKAVACQANLRQWGQIFKMYTDGNEGRWFSAGGEGCAWFRETFTLWYESPSIALCPMATKRLDPTPWKWDAFTVIRSGMYFGTNPAGTRIYGPFSYAFNDTNVSWRRSVNPPKDWRACWETSDVRGASNVPVFFDSAYPTGAPQDYQGPPPYPWIEAHTPYSMCINRHNGGINMLFLDWSVRKVGLKELWSLKWHREYNTANVWTKRGAVEPGDWPTWMQGFRDY